MKTAVIYDKWLSGMGGGEVVTCTMAAALRDNGYRVTLLSKGKVTAGEIMARLHIDITNIDLTANPQFLTANRKFDLFINTSFMDYTYGFAKKNIYYVHFPSAIRSGLFNYVLLFFQKTNLHSLFPKLIKERVDDRLRAGIYPDMKKRLNSYDTFVTHSNYVAQWTKKYWNKDAKILYPPINMKTEAVNKRSGETASVNEMAARQNWICSIGRFFTLGHGKKQEVMIEAFKRLTEAVKKTEGRGTASVENGLQLHLIGGIGNEPSSIRFIEKLKKMAAGYTVFFHLNAPRREIESILRKSKVYWHAAGYGENPKKNPIKFEHFGISPVEAVSAGCIPVLFNGGGLTEIIELLGYDKGLHLFSTIDDLVEKTIKILTNRKLISLRTKTLDDNFSSSRFKERFMRIIEEI
jgi:glycosyltransferase involved in cell wall biosynthesis